MFSKEERDAIYKVIYTRRDIRSFLPTPIEEDVIQRIFLKQLTMHHR